MRWLKKLFGVKDKPPEDLESDAGDTRSSTPEFDPTSLDETEIVEILRQFCNVPSMEDGAQIYHRLQPLIRPIGEMLDKRGGVQEMYRVFTLLGPVSTQLACELAEHWKFGNWDEWVPGPVAVNPANQTAREGESFTTKIPMANAAIQATFFDALIITGEIQDDQTGTLELAIRFGAQEWIRVDSPTLKESVVSRLTVKIPWEHGLFGVVGAGALPGGLYVAMISDERFQDDVPSYRDQFPVSGDVLWEDKPIGTMVIRGEP